MLLPGQAMQDQEIAAGVDWFLTSDQAHLMDWFNRLNDDAEFIRTMTATEIQIVRSMALIGVYEVCKAVPKGGA